MEKPIHKAYLGNYRVLLQNETLTHEKISSYENKEHSRSREWFRHLKPKVLFFWGISLSEKECKIAKENY